MGDSSKTTMLATLTEEKHSKCPFCGFQEPVLCAMFDCTKIATHGHRDTCGSTVYVRALYCDVHAFPYQRVGVVLYRDLDENHFRTCWKAIQAWKLTHDGKPE